MKKIANKIKNYLKENNITAQVKVVGETIVIDNLQYAWAQNIAEAATGLQFEHMTNSMTKLKA